MKILSPVTGMLTAAAMVLTPTVATAQKAPCQGTGCVLPLPGPAAPAPVVDAAPLPVEEAAIAAEGKSLGLLPIIIGVALAGLAAYLLLDNDDNNDEEEPVSP